MARRDVEATSVGRVPWPDGALTVPSSAIRLLLPALWRLPFGVYPIVVWIWGGESWTVSLIRLVFLIQAGVALRTARAQWNLPAALIGPTGITGPDGRRLVTWEGAAHIWVGYANLALTLWPRYPELRVYRPSGIDFARRAGTRRPTARHSMMLSSPIAPAALAAAVHGMTSVPVSTGSRRELERALVRGELRS